MASTSKPSSRAWRMNLSLLTALSSYWRRLLSVRGGFGRRPTLFVVPDGRDLHPCQPGKVSNGEHAHKCS